MDPDRPAPGRLEVVRHLLNSDDRYHGLDHAQDVDGLNRYLARVEPRHSLSDGAELPALRELRDTARDLVTAPTAHTLESLNDVARRHPVAVWFAGPDTSELRPATDAGGLDALVVEVLVAIHEAMLTGVWPRLRACRRFDCGWIYYDASPAGGMRWCSTDPCGNVMKTRAYRARTARNERVPARSDRA